MTQTKWKFECDQPFCQSGASWFVGWVEPDGHFGRGHTACDEDLAEACYVTYGQLNSEGRTANLCVLPISKTDS